MTTKSFNAQKFAWIERIVQDRNVPHFACRAAVLIGTKYLNRISGDAWPSQGQLAADMGVCRRTMQYALDALIATGHLAVQISRGSTNRYRPIFETEDAQSDAQAGAQQGAQVDAQPDAHVDQGGAQSGATDLRNLTTGGCAHSFAHNPSKKNPLKKNPLRKSLSMIIQPELIQSDFKAWYRQYPKKVGKLNAEKAYGTIISKKKATREELLAGAMRYAAERATEDPKYTKHPTTWLNQGCWHDESPQQHHPNSENRSRADSAVDGVRTFLEDPTT